jgi:hypothetical protein
VSRNRRRWVDQVLSEKIKPRISFIAQFWIADIVPDAPIAREGHTAGIVGRYLYLMGGRAFMNNYRRLRIVCLCWIFCCHTIENNELCSLLELVVF